MTQSIETAVAAERIDLIGRTVHIGVYSVDDKETVVAQATGTVGAITEDDDKIAVSLNGVDAPILWDKDQYVTKVTVDARGA